MVFFNECEVCTVTRGKNTHSIRDIHNIFLNTCFKKTTFWVSFIVKKLPFFCHQEKWRYVFFPIWNKILENNECTNMSNSRSLIGRFSCLPLTLCYLVLEISHQLFCRYVSRPYITTARKVAIFACVLRKYYVVMNWINNVLFQFFFSDSWYADYSVLIWHSCIIYNIYIRLFEEFISLLTVLQQRHFLISM